MYLKYGTLIANPDFKLSDYFDSLGEVETNYKNIESVLLITNNMIDDRPWKREENGLIKLPFNKQITFYLVQDNFDDPIFKNMGKRFKFPGEEYPIEHRIIFQTLQFEFISRELIQLLFGRKTDLKFCRHNRKFLFEKIFDDNRVMFRDEVLDGTDPDLGVFRSVFEYAFDVSVNSIKSGLEKWHGNCWCYWRQQTVDAKLKLIETVGDAEKDLKEFDAQLERFLQKYVLVSGLEVAEIEENIQESMQGIHQMEDVSSHYQVLTTNVKDWFTGPNQAMPLTKQVYDGFFSRSKLELELDYQKNYFMEQRESLLKDLFLEFEKEVPEIKSFYENKEKQSKQVLHVITPEAEESFISMRVLSMLPLIDQTQ